MEKRKFEKQIGQLIQEARELSNTGILEKDTLLSQAYKQIEVILKLNRILDEKLFEVTVINEIGSIISSVEDYEEVMRSILAIFKSILQYDIGGIVLKEKHALSIYLNLTKKIHQDELDECKSKIIDVSTWNSFDKKSDLSKQFHVENEVIMGNENIGKQEKTQKNRELTFYPIPLEIRAKTIGFIFIANFGLDISKHSKYTLNMVANQAVLVINNCQLYHRMKDMAIHDGLTGLYNHRYFQDSLEKEIQRAGRHKGSLYIMMLDIDYFKDYNDKYGHQKGDILLREFSQLLLDNVREVDLVARYGGEEFVIILPYTNKTGAINVAERIRMEVSKYPFKGTDIKDVVHKTVSIGLACYNKKKTKVDLISHADNALYRAKHGGRNMVKMEEE